MMLKTLKGNIEESRITQAIMDSSRNIWLAGLGAFATAEGEGAKLFDTLVKAGEKMETRTRKATDQAFASIKSQAGGTWDRLEEAFEERVSSALGRLNVPSKKELDALSRRVAQLNAAVDKLAPKKRVAARPARSAKAAKAA
jgi:poly(hydroxyalkanoate) granule-associated protein